MSEGILRYPVPQKVGNEIITTTIVKRGPVSFLVTTTRASLHQENETRMLSLETDDSQVQTEAVMEKIAEIEGEGSVEAISYATWHDYQRCLAAGERRVVIPWARPLRKLIRASAVRLRRDFGQLLRAIKAHALLHRFHRERDAKGRIIATIDADDDGEAGAAKVKGDYEAVRDLFADIIAEAAEVKVSKTVTATVEAVARLQPRDPKKDLSGNILVTEGATVLAVAQHLQIDRSVAQRRLRSAESRGLIVNLEKQPRPYRPSYWRALPAATTIEDLLPTGKTLKDAYESAKGGE
jgi:hypothetical protein